MFIWRCSAEKGVEFWAGSYISKCIHVSNFAVLLPFSAFLFAYNGTAFFLALILHVIIPWWVIEASILFPRTLCRCAEISVWIKALQSCDHWHLNIYRRKILSFILVYNPEDTSAKTKYMSLVSYKPDTEKIECPFIAVLSAFFIFTGLNLSLYDSIFILTCPVMLSTNCARLSVL